MTDGNWNRDIAGCLALAWVLSALAAIGQTPTAPLGTVAAGQGFHRPSQADDCGVTPERAQALSEFVEIGAEAYAAK